MFKRVKISDEKGQALVETILLIPFLFFTLLWLTQFIMAMQTSEAVQEKTRNKLVLAINNWRDLRNGGVTGVADGIAVDNVNNQNPLGNRLIYKNRNAPEKDFGPAETGGKKALRIETKLGVCRTVNCN